MGTANPSSCSALWSVLGSHYPWGLPSLQKAQLMCPEKLFPQSRDDGLWENGSSSVHWGLSQPGFRFRWCDVDERPDWSCVVRKSLWAVTLVIGSLDISVFVALLSEEQPFSEQERNGNFCPKSQPGHLNFEPLGLMLLDPGLGLRRRLS